MDDEHLVVAVDRYPLSHWLGPLTYWAAYFLAPQNLTPSWKSAMEIVEYSKVRIIVLNLLNFSIQYEDNQEGVQYIPYTQQEKAWMNSRLPYY